MFSQYEILREKLAKINDYILDYQFETIENIQNQGLGDLQQVRASMQRLIDELQQLIIASDSAEH